MALFPSGKGGGDKVAHGYKGKGVTIHILVEGYGYPIAANTTAANSSEINEVPDLLSSAKVPRPAGGRPRSCPKELQADKGYDSQPLREKLRKKKVRPIIPRRHFKGRRQRAGKKPPPLVDRFKVERCLAWMQRKFRRLVVRWERKSIVWDAFLTLGIIMMWLDRIYSAEILFG